MCYPLELRHHTRRLAGHDQSCLLPSTAIELEVSRHRADGAHELFGASPTVGLRDDAAVVTDHIHRDEACTTGAVEMLAQARVGTFCLLVLMRADETIKNLPDSQRQIVLILFKHAAHLVEQLRCCAARCPRCETAHTCTHPLRAAEQLATSVHHAPRKVMGDEGQPNFSEMAVRKSASRCPSHRRKPLHASHVTRFACGSADNPMTPR